MPIDTEAMVTAALKRAKLSEQQARMKLAGKAIDFYNYKQKEYTLDTLSVRFPKTYDKLGRYLRTFPITQELIDDISILFKRPAEITAVDTSDAVANLFQTEIVAKPNLNPILLQTHRYVNLVGKTGILCRWYEAGQQIEYVILTPDKCMVLQDPDSPTHIVALLYPKNQMTDSYTSAIPVNRWHMITDKYRYEIELTNSTNGYRILTQEDNPYGVIPVAWFTNNCETDSFWTDKDNPYVDGNIDYNVGKTLQALAIAYQMYSTLVTIGMPKEQTLEWGVTSWLNLPNEFMDKTAPDAKFITPDAKFNECNQIFENDINALASYAGISAEAYRKQNSSFQSGYAIKLSKADVYEQNELDKVWFTKSIKDLMLIACKVYSEHMNNTLASVKNISVTYPPVQIERDRAEVLQERSTERMLGIGDPLLWIMQDYDIDETAAKAMLDGIRQRANQYNPMTDDFNAEDNA